MTALLPLSPLLFLPLSRPAYHWESSNWLSPSRLRPLEAGPSPHYESGDDPDAIRRAGSTRSLQLDYRRAGSGSERGRDGTRWGLEEHHRGGFQWERRQTALRGRSHGEEGWFTGGRRGGHQQASGRESWGGPSEGLGAHGHRDFPLLHARDEESSSPIYEEYRDSAPEPEQEAEGHYDTLPPTRSAYEGYPSSPPGLNLHPAQLLPPLRAWEGQAAGWKPLQESQGALGSGMGSRSGSGDELERLLNLVSLRARRATRTHRASVSSEPTAGMY